MYDDEEYFESYRQQVNIIRISLEKYLMEHLGPRCAEYDSGCLCCQKWKALDVLLSDPIEDKMIKSLIVEYED